MLPIDLYAQGWQDRSDRVRWLLEEMQVPYTNHFLDKAAGELNTPQYRRLNPLGRVPTIVDGDIVMSESAAVCMYLADRYSYGILAPKMEDINLRAQYTKWMIFSVGTLECVIARMFTHVNTPEETKVTHQYVSEQCEILKMLLNPILEKQEYILSSGFSAADIMLAAVLPGAQDYLITNNPPILNYMKRLVARQAAINAKVF